jgi:hypothetical protein
VYVRRSAADGAAAIDIMSATYEALQCEWINGANIFYYIFKYFYKGVDKASFRITRTDEDRETDAFDDFVSARYLSCVEAVYRILGFTSVLRILPSADCPFNSQARSGHNISASLAPTSLRSWSAIGYDQTPRLYGS